MKTYNEMTESVLKLAKARAAAQKRKRRKIFGLVGATTCVALVLVAAIVAKRMERPTVSAPQETESNETTPPAAQRNDATVVLLSTVDGQQVEDFLKPGVATPTEWLIRVRDIRGLSEAERKKALREEEDFADALWEKNKPNWKAFKSTTRHSNTIISHICTGCLSVTFDDLSLISSMDVETTGTGTIFRSSWSAWTEPRGGIQLDWVFSSETRKILDKEPETPLSTFEDTIVLTVNYKDGSQKIFTFYITLNDEGQVFVTQKRPLV